MYTAYVLCAVDASAAGSTAAARRPRGIRKVYCAGVTLCAHAIKEKKTNETERKKENNDKPETTVRLCVRARIVYVCLCVYSRYSTLPPYIYIYAFS